MSKPTTADDSALATVAAGLLRRGTPLHQLSVIITALFLARLAFGGFIKAAPCCPWLQALTLALGAAEFWYAGRVAVDAEFFSGFAAGKSDLKSFDEALSRLHLKKETKTARSMEDRARGGLELLKIQAGCLACQAIAFVTLFSGAME